MQTGSIWGRSILVTGASRGIGKGIARVFARAGAKVLIVARDGKQAEAAAEEITAAGGVATPFTADVTNAEQMREAARTAATRYGGLDVLCANAGIFAQAKLEDMKPELWDEVMSTNLKGTFLSVQACVPYLKKSDQGRIVLTSSITGPITGFPGWTHYGATKAGQLGFMRTASIELAKYGITVNAVLPGNIVTEGLQGLGDEYLKAMAAAIPLKRLGDVEDIGNAALFLASKQAGYIPGQTIVVDGGQTLPESLDALAQAYPALAVAK
jgi:3-oxoacyl-[acyl-carrier protein] reductase